jgi:hypothetical protein
MGLRETEEVKIHGENAISIACIMELLQQPDHPFYRQAKSRARKFLEAEREVRLKRSQKAMQDQMEYMDLDEWSRIVD